MHNLIAVNFRLFFVLVCVCASLRASAGIESMIVPYTATEDVVYGQKEGMGLTMDVLTPEKDAKGIGIVLISSGSWKSSKSNVPEEVAEFRKDHWAMGLLSHGFTAFVVRHGSGPRFHVPEMVEDVRRAVRFIRLHAADYGVDPDHLGITSGSSGGHLALMVGMTGDDGNAESKDPVERVSCRTQAIVSWFPPTDLINFGVSDGYTMIEKLQPKRFTDMFGTITDLPAQLKDVSPIYFTTPDDPPLLLIHGDSDRTVPLQQSEVLKAKYEEAGLTVKLIVQPGGGHSYWDGIEKQYVDVAQWFDSYLSGVQILTLGHSEKYDDASWHYEGEFPEGSPKQYGGTHIALYLKWCFMKGFAGEIPLRNSPQEVEQVIAGKLAATEYLFSQCDGKITDVELTEEGNAFTAKYYGNGEYFDDYVSLFADELYEAGEEKIDFKRLADVLDKRYEEFKSASRIAPSDLK